MVRNATAASVFSVVPFNISFRRALAGQNLIFWHDLIARICHVYLNNSKDIFLMET